MSSREPETTTLIGAYVLGACSPEEAAEVQARMVVDPEFRREIESYAVVREALLQAPEPPPERGPDAAARSRIMDVVRQEASLFEAARPAGAREAETVPASSSAPTPSDAPRAVPGVPPAAEVPSPSAPSLDAPGQSPRRQAFAAALRSPARIGALVAVIVAVVVGVSVLGSGGSDSSGQRVTAQVVGDAAGKGKAELVVEDGRARVKLSGFPDPGTGRKYEVWLKTGNADPRPTTVLFDVDADGNGEATIDDIENVDNILLTSEPASGSPAPTRPPVMLASVPA